MKINMIKKWHKKIRHNLIQTGFSSVDWTFMKKIITENWGGGIKIILYFTEYIGFFLAFWALAGRSTKRFYWIYWILSTFRLFDFLPGGQNDWFYWPYLIFSTFRLFDILVGGQNDWLYWIIDFLTIRLFDLFWEV